MSEKVKTRAGVVYPYLSSFAHLAKDRLSETVALGAAIDLDIAYCSSIRLRKINAAAFFGKGMQDTLRDIITRESIALLIVDADLSPIQQRNLEKGLNVKIIDRTALILEIFGERARTKEGSLQVELAHLTYQRSRLVRSWTHLERQRGGAGFLGGPGETQIELDRRIIDDKIVKIKKELEKIKQTRGLQRRSRQKVPYPIVALVGYTNAGKSTLFNYLTHADVFAKDLLFATLDTTMRRLVLPSKREVIFSDTVGFISDLPHELIMAFRATLEEVLEADIILQVIDASNPSHAKQRNNVLEVLHHLGLERIEHQKNYIEVYNKSDLLTQNNLKSSSHGLYISALSGAGIKELLKKIDAILSENHQEINLDIPAGDGKTLAWLYRNAEIISLKNQDDKVFIRARMSRENIAKLQGLKRNSE